MRFQKILGLPPRSGTRWEARGSLPEQVADFEPRPMVAWFAPGQLLRTAFRSLFAQVIASYVDRRETQAALPPCLDPPDDRLPCPGSAFRGLVDADFTAREGKQEVWIDYIADLGDGWDPAYTMALLLARPKVRVRGLEDASLRDASLVQGAHLRLGEDELPRADVLVLGGDQVYPTPSRAGYTDRLLAPLVCAFPALDPPPDGVAPHPEAKERPLLFAIPGNHDWYDGLTDFLRVFCQCAAIGRWRTRQRRSYFAVRLPFRWWLWGIDIQLDTRIDPVQLDHFRKLARTRDEEGDDPKSIVLCTAQPSWIYGRTGLENCYKNLMYFEEGVMGPRRKGGGRGRTAAGEEQERKRPQIPVTLAGDMHHYARYLEYEKDDGGDPARQRITCGGGGSYARGTYALPRRIPRPDRPSRRPMDGKMVPRNKGELLETGFPYPSRTDSKRLALGALRLPLLRHNRSFCLLLGVLYAVLAAAAGEVGRGSARPGPFGWRALWTYLRSLRPEWGALRDHASGVAGAVADRPFALAMLAAALLTGMGLALVFNPGTRHRLLAALWGLLHGAAHAALALLLAWGAASLARNGLHAEPRWHGAAVYALVVLAGGILGGFLVGVYLVVSSLGFRLHDNEVFSVQSIPHFRSFLRLRIDVHGDLTIYPLGVRRVPRRWRRRSQRQSGDPHFEPADDVVPDVHLLEAPLRIRRPPVPPAGAEQADGGTAPAREGEAVEAGGAPAA